MSSACDALRGVTLTWNGALFFVICGIVMVSIGFSGISVKSKQ
jgi:hypothetical protein